MKLENTQFDVAIIGAGVTGTALAHLLARYTDVKRIGIFEKYDEPAQVSSKATNNSQTLHFGDIETNYSLEKAKKVKGQAQMVADYVEREDPGGEAGLYLKRPKMVLGVGEKEVAKLKRRYQAFRNLFPKLREVGREALAELEPAVVDGRDPDVPICALYNPKGYIMNYELLAKSFLQNAENDNPDGVKSVFGCKITKIKRLNNNFVLKSEKGEKITARYVVAATGAYSLTLAQRMGYGERFTIIPVAGNFYKAPNRLNAKVYTVQHESLPFAAIHGDPEVSDPDLMRFGPIAKAMPILEPRQWRTFWQFLDVFKFNWNTFKSVVKVNSDPAVIKFVSRHFFYDWPIIGRRAFVRIARKIIPTMRVGDLEYGSDFGGIRPQIVDTETQDLQLGEAKIVEDGLIFNITPSPGASVCLANAKKDLNTIINYFDGEFAVDKKTLQKDYSSIT
jgi:malate dehydrogenase (quinone)